MEQDEQQRLDFLCPTFTTTDTSAETAARVATTSSYLTDSDADFEFDLVQTDVNLNNLSLGEVFPVFNRDVLGTRETEDAGSATSSDEDDDLEGVPASTYCVWRPRKVEEDMPGRVKKSGSSGSGSKRWKILDLLRRSNSEGKGDFVFLTPKGSDGGKSKTDKGNLVFSSRNNRDAIISKKDGKGDLVFPSPTSKDANKLKTDGKGKLVIFTPKNKSKAKGSAVEEFYMQNRASKEGQKRKSYLPYKKDLVGFFANVKGIGRS